MNTITTFINDPQVHGALYALALVAALKLWPYLKGKLDAYVAGTSSKFDDEILKKLEEMIDAKLADASKTNSAGKEETK